jgi:hypothetical protein
MKNPKPQRDKNTSNLLAIWYPEAFVTTMASNSRSTLAPRHPAFQTAICTTGANREAINPSTRFQKRDDEAAQSRNAGEDGGPKLRKTILSSESLFRLCALL